MLEPRKPKNLEANEPGILDLIGEAGSLVHLCGIRETVRSEPRRMRHLERNDPDEVRVRRIRFEIDCRFGDG